MVLRLSAAAAAAALVIGAFPGTATAATPSSPDGPVIHHNGDWYLRTTPSGGAAERQFHYGRGSDIGLMGDWNGNGVDTVGVVRGHTWYLSNQVLAGGTADVTLNYGSGRDLPIVGDWNGDGTDTPGVVRDAAGSYQLWLLRNSNTGRNANSVFTFGGPAFAEDFPIETNPRLTVQTS